MDAGAGGFRRGDGDGEVEAAERENGKTMVPRKKNSDQSLKAPRVSRDFPALKKEMISVSAAKNGTALTRRCFTSLRRRRSPRAGRILGGECSRD